MTVQGRPWLRLPVCYRLSQTLKGLPYFSQILNKVLLNQSYVLFCRFRAGL